MPNAHLSKSWICLRKRFVKACNPLRKFGSILAVFDHGHFGFISSLTFEILKNAYVSRFV